VFVCVCVCSSVTGSDGPMKTVTGDHRVTPENVELMSDDRRQEIAVKLASDGCEIGLTLVYSDQSTQLREVTTVTKVHEIIAPSVD